MRLAALQPAYLPWLGHFEQIHFSDKFVVLEDLQFSRGSWVNRNRILNNGNPQWLTIPILNHTGKRINELVIDNSKKWRKKHTNSLEVSYSENPYLRSIVQIIHNSYFDNLNEFLTNLNKYFYSEFDFVKKIEYIKSDNLSEDRNQRLVDICKDYGATQYLTGFSANSYIDIKYFEKNGIEVIFQQYKPVKYAQKAKNFVPYMSIVDCLFNGYTPAQIIENKFFNDTKYF